MNFQTIAKLLHRIPQPLMLNKGLPAGLLAAAPLHKAYKDAISRGWAFDWHHDDRESSCTIQDETGEDVQTLFIPRDDSCPEPASIPAILSFLNIFEVQGAHRQRTSKSTRNR